MNPVIDHTTMEFDESWIMSLTSMECADSKWFTYQNYFSTDITCIVCVLLLKLVVGKDIAYCRLKPHALVTMPQFNVNLSNHEIVAMFKYSLIKAMLKIVN